MLEQPVIDALKTQFSNADGLYEFSQLSFLSKEGRKLKSVVSNKKTLKSDHNVRGSTLSVLLIPRKT